MDTRRLILATVLSALVLFGFEYFFPQTQPASVTPPAVTQSVDKPVSATQVADATHSDTQDSSASDAPARVTIDAPAVMGSINLRGARLDDLLLKQYRETVQPDSPDVRVLSPAASKRADFVDFGWRAAPDTQVRLPDSQSLWRA
ncbi:membrane protein insertase YidC, partial [Acetobacter peroxydans]